MLFAAFGYLLHSLFFFFSSRRRHTRFDCDWSSDVCSSDLSTNPNPCVASTGGVISVDQNGLPGQGDSSNPTLGGTNRIAFTSQASLLSGVSGRQVYVGNVCASFGGLS